MIYRHDLAGKASRYARVSNAPDKIVITKPNETEVRSMIPCDSAGKFDPVVEDAMRKIVTSPLVWLSVNLFSTKSGKAKKAGADR